MLQIDLPQTIDFSLNCSLPCIWFLQGLLIINFERHSERCSLMDCMLHRGISTRPQVFPYLVISNLCVVQGLVVWTSAIMPLPHRLNLIEHFLVDNTRKRLDSRGGLQCSPCRWGFITSTELGLWGGLFVVSLLLNYRRHMSVFRQRQSTYWIWSSMRTVYLQVKNHYFWLLHLFRQVRSHLRLVSRGVSVGNAIFHSWIRVRRLGRLTEGTNSGVAIVCWGVYQTEHCCLKCGHPNLIDQGQRPLMDSTKFVCSHGRT